MASCVAPLVSDAVPFTLSLCPVSERLAEIEVRVSSLPRGPAFLSGPGRLPFGQGRPWGGWRPRYAQVASCAPEVLTCSPAGSGQPSALARHQLCGETSPGAAVAARRLSARDMVVRVEDRWTEQEPPLSSTCRRACHLCRVWFHYRRPLRKRGAPRATATSWRRSQTTEHGWKNLYLLVDPPPGNFVLHKCYCKKLIFLYSRQNVSEM